MEINELKNKLNKSEVELKKIQNSNKNNEEIIDLSGMTEMNNASGKKNNEFTLKKLVNTFLNAESVPMETSA